MEMVHYEASQQNLGVKVNERAIEDLVSSDVNIVVNDTEQH